LVYTQLSINKCLQDYLLSGKSDNYQGRVRKSDKVTYFDNFFQAFINFYFNGLNLKIIFFTFLATNPINALIISILFRLFILSIPIPQPIESHLLEKRIAMIFS
jgi:hypothetical protein